MGIEIHQVDAFAREPFTGNPAAVCLPGAARDDVWLQKVAAEMNLSETAFLWAEEGAWRLRWLTPTTEVDLCGHATLASAHVLWETGRAEGAIRFLTRSGVLEATREGEAIALDFPSTAPAPCAPPAGLFDALGAEGECHRSRFDVLVRLSSEAAVRALRPDLRALAAIDARGVIVTAEGDAHDFVSRFFAPAAGVDEDPVTGSAHCALAPFWAERLGRSRLRAYQASARGGELEVEVAGDRVRLFGHAITVLSGELKV